MSPISYLVLGAFSSSKANTGITSTPPFPSGSSMSRTNFVPQYFFRFRNPQEPYREYLLSLSITYQLSTEIFPATHYHMALKLKSLQDYLVTGTFCCLSSVLFCTIVDLNAPLTCWLKNFHIVFFVIF